MNDRTFRIHQVEITGVAGIFQIQEDRFAERPWRGRGANQRDGARA